MVAAALVPAAGLGVRMGTGAQKALRLLAGEPLLVHAVRGLLAARMVAQVVVAAPPGQEDVVRRLLPAGVLVVPGGATRTDSVAAALAAADPALEVVLVHDAARPLTPPALIDAVVGVVLDGAGAVVPALPVTDTVKRVDAAGRVLGTVDRADLRAVQTPQGFRREVLLRAYAAAAADSAAGARAEATDDAGLVERLGLEVVTVVGSDEAFKVTRPADLLFAETLLAGRRATP